MPKKKKKKLDVKTLGCFSLPPLHGFNLFLLLFLPLCMNPLYKRDLETSVPLASPPGRIKPSFFPSIYFLVAGGGGEQEL